MSPLLYVDMSVLFAMFISPAAPATTTYHHYPFPCLTLPAAVASSGGGVADAWRAVGAPPLFAAPFIAAPRYRH